MEYSYRVYCTVERQRDKRGLNDLSSSLKIERRACCMGGASYSLDTSRSRKYENTKHTVLSSSLRSNYLYMYDVNGFS
jgi:hypothetical protein